MFAVEEATTTTSCSNKLLGSKEQKSGVTLDMNLKMDSGREEYR